MRTVKTKTENSETENSKKVGKTKTTRTKKAVISKNDSLKKMETVIDEINQMTNGKRTSAIFKLEAALRRLKLANGDTVDGLIFQTMNPAQFGSIEGNRIVNVDSVYSRQLAESLSKFGNVSPVIVNEHGNTVDGQRRIGVMEKYQIQKPLRYTRVVGANIDTVGDINRLQFKWTFKDWMHKYVKMQKPDYIEYAEIEKKYEKYMRSRSLRSLLMNGRVESFKAEVWESGDFTINHENLPFALKFLDFLPKVYEVGAEDNIFARDRNFQKALYDVYRSVTDIDEARLLKKIRLGFARLNVRADIGEYRKILIELYSSRMKRVQKETIAKEIGSSVALAESA